jgi:hypothetical protein
MPKRKEALMKRLALLGAAVAALALAGTTAAALVPWTFVGTGKTCRGTIQTVDVLNDVQGTADLSHITVNGTTEVPVPTTVNGPTSKSQCKHGGWRTFTSPKFRNQGECVSWYEHHRSASNGR